MDVIIYGGTGQAIVDRPILEAAGHKIIAVFDDTPGLKPPFEDIPLYHGSKLEEWHKSIYWPLAFVVAIGNPHGRARLMIADRLILFGMTPADVVHPQHFGAGEYIQNYGGLQVMAGAVIQPRVHIGRQVIINTNASVDHECELDDGCEVGPGATLCGCVHLGPCSWVGAGSVVLPRLTIGHDSIVGAGSVVTKDIPPGQICYGNPAKFVRFTGGE